jgi:uncharacterized protein (DUF1810 family)
VEPSDPYNLQRFVDAQERIFATALVELRAGRKESHWMWFIFPQLGQLGRSSTAKFYGIASLDEARAYLQHPTLGPRLDQCVEAIQRWARKRSAREIFGAIDAMKLRSSLTLFDVADPRGQFEQALVNFFGGEPDQLTLALLSRGQ